ncbi:MAG: VanW family protein [Clostridia bacterium]|nr:VanW family protein [Clostridia bacterium]
MKKTSILKLNILILAPAFSAGLIFFGCGFFGRVPSSVEINGIAVGGKSPQSAVALVREAIVAELKQTGLTVVGDANEYRFTYPEISYKDNLQNLIKSVKKGKSYTAQVSYYLNGLSETVDIICNNESRQKVEPYAIFNSEGAPFTYFEGADGCTADKNKLINDIKRSLSGGFEDVRVKTETVKRQNDLRQVRYDTRRLSTFVTYFDGGNETRSHNIRLAAGTINGSILKNGEVFSFNQTVGERTAKRGFQPAKIIEKGEFVEGIGGGVCQVSTTLYNAALLCGCEICEYHPHSLSVSYVPPSCDAMVSGNYFDLKFKNVTGTTLYIRARTGKNYVAFDVYGRGDGNEYFYNSEVTGTIPAPEEITEDYTLVKDGKDGTESAGYLTVKRKGSVIKRKLVRRDKYAPIKKIVLVSDTAEEEVDKNETARNG